MILRVMKPLGALTLLVVGGVHLQQYAGADFKSVPTIGTLFLLNAIASGLVGVALLLPLERIVSARRADVVVGVCAVAGVGIAVGSLIALFISESGSLFGFSESGYRAAIVLAVVAEAATAVLLAPVAGVTLARVRDRRRATSEERARRHRLGHGSPA